MNRQFSRSQMLLGEEGMNLLAQGRVIIFGIGGVGSWAAEALVRTGLRHLTIVDADRVAPSNINRQAPALSSNIGEPKTEAMLRRLLDINPEAEITTVCDLYSASTAHLFDLEAYDVVIDAIDSLSDKALLINRATRTARKVVLLSSMGAALRLDPTQVAVARFERVQGCKLAAALRRKFRHEGVFPARRFQCVYSTEPPMLNHPLADNAPSLQTAGDVAPHTADDVAPQTACHDAPMSFNKAVTNGSLCPVTATFGMTLASLAIRALIRPPE